MKAVLLLTTVLLTMPNLTFAAKSKSKVRAASVAIPSVDTGADANGAATTAAVKQQAALESATDEKAPSQTTEAIVPQSLDPQFEEALLEASAIPREDEEKSENPGLVLADESATPILLAAAKSKEAVKAPPAEGSPAATENSEASATKASTENLKESEIPVLNTAKAKKEETSSPFGRVIFSLVIIAIAAGGLVYFSKWYNRSTKKSADTNRIRVLNQHFFGPKKSVAIVRIAGETMLLGITDQNVALLKTLSLLDDELPESTPVHFDSALKTADLGDSTAAARSTKTRSAAVQNEDGSNDEFLLGHIKDKISSKLKGMRNI